MRKSRVSWDRDPPGAVYRLAGEPGSRATGGVGSVAEHPGALRHERLFY